MRMISPADADYDSARRLFSANFDRRPSTIARVAEVAEIPVVIDMARDQGLELAVRSGGHSNAGHGSTDGGLVLDLSELKGLDIDVEGRTAWAQSGLTAGEYTEAAAEHGLATGFGDTGSVGLGGITLGGGVGFLVRKHGLTIDDLLEVELVTADGELVRASEDENPDLFWALRGGGGNFGVATRFRYRLHEVGTIVGGMLILPAGGAVLAGFLAAADEAPDELSTIAAVMKAPPMPFLPPQAHGKLIVMAQMAYCGPVEQADSVLAPFRALAEPIADLLRPMPYPDIYPPEDPDFRPIASIRTMFMDSVDEETADAIVARIEGSTAPMAVAQLRVLGGALARVPADATAYSHRDRRIMANIASMAMSVDELPERAAWVAEVSEELNPGDDSGYVGFLGDEGDARVRAAYSPETYDRLTAIKAEWDPDNVFRLNQNIPPVPVRA